MEKLFIFIDPRIIFFYLSTFFNKTGSQHESFNNTKHHRRKRFLNQPILRPDDKDGTPRCNKCDNDNSYCDMVSDS